MKKIVLPFLIFFLAFALARDIFAPQFALIGDEYAFFYDAASIATNGIHFSQIFSQHGVYGYHPVADSIYQAVWMKLFGVNLIGWKSANIITMCLSMLLIYSIAFTLFGTYATAITATIFFGFSHYLFGFAHIGYNNLQAFIPFLSAILCFFRFQSTKRPIYFFLTGLCTSACFYTFFAARLILIVLLPFLIIHRKKIHYFFAGFFLLFLPFLIANQTTWLSAMLSRTFAHPYYHGIPWNVITSLVASLALHTNGTQHHFVTTPLFSPILLLSYFIGCITLSRAKKKIISIVLALWSIGLGILITIIYPSIDLPTTRLFIIIPAVCLVAAIGLMSVIHNKFVLLVILLLYMANEGYLFYFVTPKAQTENTIMRILTLAQRNPTKHICVDKKLDDPPQAISLYAKNVLIGVRNKASCDIYYE